MTHDAIGNARAADAAEPRLARAWAPLALAGLLAALAGPLLNRTLALGAEPRAALAGFWLGYSVLLLLEAACFVWQPTALAFLRDRHARRRLVLYALATGALSAALVAAAGTRPVASFVFGALVPTSPAAAVAAGDVLRALVALPVLVALRGVFAASVLRDGRGAAIPAGLLVRLAVLAAWRGRGGAGAACDALLAAAAVELLVLALVRATPGPRAHAVAAPAARVARVAAPLVVSTLAWAALRPLLQSLLGHLAHAELAQARFGLVFAVFMTVGAPVWAVQDVAVLADVCGADAGSVRRFALRVAGGVTLALALVLLAAAIAPAARGALGFGAATGGFAWPAFALLLALPLVVAVRAPAQGALIARHRTGPFARVPLARVASTAFAGLLATRAWPWLDGATLGAALLLAGEAFEARGYGRAAARAAERAESDPAAQPLALGRAA